MINKTSLDSLCAALSYAMGIEPPKESAPACKELTEFIDNKLGGKKAERILCIIPTL